MKVSEVLIATRALIDTPEKWRVQSASCPLLFLAVAPFVHHPDTTHAEVMDFYDRAIAAEQEREAQT